MITIARIPRKTRRFFKGLGDHFALPAWDHFWGLVLAITISHGSTVERLAKLLGGSTHRTNHGEFLWRSDWNESWVIRHKGRMNVLPTEKRVRVVAALVEGNSIRATCRMTGATKNTILKLLVDLGEASAFCQRQVMQNLCCKRLQLDEVWTFCYPQRAHVPAKRQGVFGRGDVWTWVALDADTKLVPCRLVGRPEATGRLARWRLFGSLAGTLDAIAFVGCIDRPGLIE